MIGLNKLVNERCKVLCIYWHIQCRFVVYVTELPFGVSLYLGGCCRVFCQVNHDCSVRKSLCYAGVVVKEFISVGT